MFSVFLLISAPAFAKSSVVKAIPTGNNTSDGLIQPASIAPSTYVASLTIFADPTDDGTGSSGNGGILSFGRHAFITVKNTSSSNIQVGLLGGIAPGKTVSVGTWGNKTEHKGLWYNLEEYGIYNYGWYNGRISVSQGLTSSQLSSLTSYIINNDYWSATTNCSSFACSAWNLVADSNNQLSAGYPNTPKNLGNYIINKYKYVGVYHVGEAVPYDYMVYYAQGTGTPKQSTIYR